MKKLIRRIQILIIIIILLSIWVIFFTSSFKGVISFYLLRTTPMGVANIIFSYDSKTNNKLYNSYNDAVWAWAEEFRDISKDREWGGYIYSYNIKENGEWKTKYTYSKTYKGGTEVEIFGFQIRANAVAGAILGYLDTYERVQMYNNGKVVGFTHSHPTIRWDNINIQLTEEQKWTLEYYFGLQFSDEDKSLSDIFGIEKIFAVPYWTDEYLTLSEYTKGETVKHPIKLRDRMLLEWEEKDSKDVMLVVLRILITTMQLSLMLKNFRHIRKVIKTKYLSKRSWTFIIIFSGLIGSICYLRLEGGTNDRFIKKYLQS